LPAKTAESTIPTMTASAGRFCLLGHAGAAALDDQDKLPVADAHHIDGDNGPPGVAEARRL